MCGLAGAVETARTSDPDRLAARGWAMAGCLEHRGPDDGGVWTDPAAGVVLAHRRLAIIDLSPTGHQPMTSASGRYALVYNGEIYNFAELRRDLADGGHRLRGSSDTEVLLELAARDGLVPTLRRCRGMFALALHDRQAGTVTLARDRFGEKPLYYGWSGSTFLFASEASALRVHPDFDADIDRRAVVGLLSRSYVPAPLSIFRGASKLRPGCVVEVAVAQPGRVVGPTAWWSLDDVVAAGAAEPFTGSDEEAVDAVEAVLQGAVTEAMVSDVPLGAFLSGGVDSSTVVALMQAVSASPVRTYTVGFDVPEYDEAAHGAAVAAHLGTAHTALHVTSTEAQAVVPDLAAMYDEPFADASQVPTALVSRLARRDVKVVLSGDGGDELFGGYSRYATGASRWQRVERTPRPLRRGVARVLGAARRTERLAVMLAAGRPEELYDVLLTHWLDPEAVVLGAEPGPVASRVSASHGDLIGSFMHRDTTTYLPDAVLAKVDRAAMSTSLETRVPMLDPRVAALAWRLPPRLRGGERGRADKVVLRRLLERYVPKELVDRPKMGFGVPIDAWLRGPLRPWAEDLLTEAALRRHALLDPEPVRAAWADLQSGRRSTHQEVWTVLMLQQWLEAPAPPVAA